MKAQVDISRRLAKQRAHTATHLLHAALQQYFPHTKQEWSFVWEDELRFDFAADGLLTNEQIDAIVGTINQQISTAYTVHTQTMAYDAAVQLWAKAFFADTYGETVRVVSIALPDTNVKSFLSLELCGWNHVTNTSEIWAFVIMRQEAVASWVKRIQAYTWPRVLERIKQDNIILQGMTTSLSLKQAAQLPEKVEKLLKEYAELQSSQQSLKQALLHMINTHVAFQSPIALHEIVTKYPALTEQDILQYIENTEPYKNAIWIAYTNQADGTSIVTVYDAVWWQAKTQATQLGVRGGWSDKKVTGKLPTHFSLS